MSSTAPVLESLPATQSGRRASVDFLRFLASFGIVWAHSLGSVRPDLAQYGYEALSLFCILMAYYSVRSLDSPADRVLQPRSSRRVSSWLFQRRVYRIAVPWLFWCAFYLVLTAAISGDLRAMFVIEDPYSLLVGPVIHLWFLPFAFLASGAFLLPSSRLNSAARVKLACLAAVPFSAVLFYLHDQEVLPAPFVQWAFATPSFLFGILVALGERHRVEPYAWAFFVSVCLVFLALNNHVWPAHLLVTAAIFGAAKLIRTPSNQFLKDLGALALGVYLIHPFYMAVVYKFAETSINPILSAFLVFALSAVTVFILLRIPVLRRVV